MFELTREEKEPQTYLYDSTNSGYMGRNCPESPSILSVKAQAIPVVSAKMGPNFSPAKSNRSRSPVKAKNFSSRKSPIKKATKENHTEEQLMADFYRAAIGDRNTDELEKVQLQKAIGALSEKLLLFQNISEDKAATE